MRDYRGDIGLTPDPSGGTDIRWRATFNPPVFGTGWLLQRYLGGYMQRCVDGLARYAGGRPIPGARPPDLAVAEITPNRAAQPPSRAAARSLSPTS